MNFHNCKVLFAGPASNAENEPIDGFEDTFYDYNNFYGGPCMEPPLVWDDDCGSSRYWNGPIQWRGSASMVFSKSRVEDEWLGETHTSTSNSLDWHSWKIEKVASGGWVKLQIDNVLVME